MKEKWYENSIVITVFIVLCFPFGLLFMWSHSHWKLRTKILISFIIASIIFVVALTTSPDAERITIAPEAIYAEPDMIKLFSLSVEPYNANPGNIRYFSSDNAVARAEKGKITTVSPGVAEIYAEDIKSGVKSNTVKIIVLESLSDELSEKYPVIQGEEHNAPSSVVYITQSGTKYHRSDCYVLGDDKAAITIEEAVSKELSPCKKCKP